MIIHIINRQNVCKPNNSRIKVVLNFLMANAAPDFAASGRAELSLLLTDDENIRKIKRHFFDVDRVTDVISFSSRPLPADDKHRTAEIVVNVERARLEGKKRRGFEHEFALYLAHGCDHLAGHDDRTTRERNKMRRRELRWLKMATKLRLLAGLFMPALNPKHDSLKKKLISRP